MNEHNLEIIKTNIKGTAVINRLMMSLGFNAGDNQGRLEATSYAASVIAEIEKSAGDEKKDLTDCSWQSISQCMVDAARFKVYIDARQHAHMIKFHNKHTKQNEVQLQIGYRAFLAKISEHYDDVDFTARNIYAGDVLDINDVNGFQHYQLTINDPFADKAADYRGTMVAISYRKGENRFQKVTTISKDEIAKIRRKAKFDSVWAEWFGEKAIAATIKRAGKIHFASIQGLQEIIKYDNEKNFDLDRVEAPESSAGPLIENLNKSLDNRVSESPASLPAPEETLPGDLHIPEENNEPEPVPVDRDEPIEAQAQTMADEPVAETDSQREERLKSTAAQIRSFIANSKDEGDLYALWTVDCKVDVEELRQHSTVAYDFLKDEYDKKMRSFAGFA